MLFRPSLLLILVFIAVTLCKPAKQDEKGGENDDYEHEESENDDAPVVEDKAVPDDGSPKCHKDYEERLQSQDTDAEQHPTELDQVTLDQAENTRNRQNRLSKSKRRHSDDQSKDGDKQRVAEKLSEFEEDNADLNGEKYDLTLDYSDIDRQESDRMQPVQRQKNMVSKKNKHWFDFYRNRRHTQNSKMQKANENGPEDEENAIKRHIKKLTSDELELLLKSLSDEKRILLQSIIDSDENFNKREITKKAGVVEENNMISEADSRQSKLNVHDTVSDATEENMITVTAKTLQTRSANFHESDDKIENTPDVMDSEYDFNENAMLQSAKAESKRDAREDYDPQSEGPDDDEDENVKLDNDHQSSRRIYKRTADSQDDKLAESMKSLEESFSNNFNLDSEMVPLIRVKRTHDNGQNYTLTNGTRIDKEENNELDNIDINETLAIAKESQASLVAAEGENVLDNSESAEPDIIYNVNDESPEIKDWNLFNCSCIDLATNMPDDSVSTDLQPQRSTKETESSHPINAAIETELKHDQKTTDVKLIENSSEKEFMYQDSENIDPIPKTKGLQRYKRIRRMKQSPDK